MSNNRAAVIKRNLDLLIPSAAPASMTTLWGTVNTTGTRVLLDGETTELPVGTPSLVQLKAGARVAVDRYGKSLRVTGILATSAAADPGLIPAGVSWEFLGSTAPAGWLPEDGAAYNRAAYARLFAVIGTTFGTGNGSTTFNIPTRANYIIKT